MPPSSSQPEHSCVRKLASILGYTMLALGLFLLSPLSDLLPVDIWYSFKSLFSSENPTYLKVVPTTQSRVPIVALAAVGLILVLLARKLPDRRNK